jgi:hypothetical protein
LVVERLGVDDLIVCRDGEARILFVDCPFCGIRRGRHQSAADVFQGHASRGELCGINLETDLLRIRSDIVRETRAAFGGPPVEAEIDSSCSARSPAFVFDPQQRQGPDGEDGASVCTALPMSVRNLTCCFIRLNNVGNGAFERLGRYNAALWKQTAQTLFLLQTVRRPQF